MTIPPPGLTRVLAEFVAGCAPAAIPETARGAARLAIADCIGGALAGAADEAAVRARAAVASADASCTVWGTARRAGSRDAALLNGTAAHALAIDDTNESMRGHPSAPIVPAILALGEAGDADGAQVLGAYVVGVEVAARVGRAVNDHHSEIGWHTSVTLGTLGAAAAASQLLRLDAVRTAHAIGIAAGMAGGLRANFGTMTKALGPGLAAQNGMLAASLAGTGVSANPDVLESHEGFLAMFCGTAKARPARALAGLGTAFEVERPGVTFKIYPNCSLIHTTIDMVLEGVTSGELEAESIRGIEVLISPRLERLRVACAPETPLQAKFSVEYAVACALQRRAVGVAEFTLLVLHDRTLRALMEKVSVRVGEGFDAENGDRAAVRVTRADGSSWSRTLAKPRGHRTNPLPAEMLEQKFRSLAGPVVGAERVSVLWSTLQAIETVGCRRLVSLLAGRLAA